MIDINKKNQQEEYNKLKEKFKDKEVYVYLKRDRKSVVQGKSVDLGGRRIIKKKKKK